MTGHDATVQLSLVATFVLVKTLLSAASLGMSDLHSCQQSGILFFDNFDGPNPQTIQQSLWNESSEVFVQKTCNIRGLGNAARLGSGRLVTIPIDTSSAKAFAFDAALCQGSGNASGQVLYTSGPSSTFIHSTDFSVTSISSVRIVVMITEAMRGRRVRFGVQQTDDGSNWTADNFAIFGGNYDLEQISDDFDPMKNCTWIEKSTATVTRYCVSDGNSLAFTDSSTRTTREVVTRPIFLPGLLPDESSYSRKEIIFREDFKTGTSIPNSRWRSIMGGAVSPTTCGINQTEDSAVAFFNGTGERFIETRRLDLTSALVMSFFVSIGGRSCGAGKSGQDVVLQYSPDGRSNYTDLRLLSYKDYKTSKCVFVNLPEGARTLATALRWRQLTRNTDNDTVGWAIDKIRIGDQAGKLQLFSDCSTEDTTLYRSDFSDIASVPGGIWNEMSGGTITVPDCGSIDLPGSSSQAAFFNKTGRRSIQTEPLDIRTARALSFRVRIGGGDGCDNADLGHEVEVVYSTSNMSNQVLTRLNVKAYRSPKTVYVDIPTTAKTETTVIRWYQSRPSSSGKDEWALDRVRILADPVSQKKGKTLFVEDFSSSISIPNKLWAASAGAEFRTPDCGSIDLPRNESTAAFFTMSRDRFIQTQTLDLTLAHKLSFRVRIGGGSGCETADTGDDVVVEYKTLSQNQFQRLTLLTPTLYGQAKEVPLQLPQEAKTTTTVLRWRQVLNSGKGYDEWAIDRIRVTSSGSPAQVLFEDDFSPPPVIPGPKWAAIAGGLISTPDCGNIDSPRSNNSEAAFFSLTGSRFLQTQSLDLIGALSVVFQIKIGGDGGCESADTGDDVVLEFKTSSSLDFTTLQLMGYDQFKIATTVTASLPLQARTAGTVLRWRQLDNSGNGYDEWAIDSIRILDSVSTNAPEEIGNMIAERFDSTFSTPSVYWQGMTGGAVRVPPCGSISIPQKSDTALYFSLAGSRYIQSKRLDLTTARSLSFRLRIGGGSGCEKAEPAEGVVLEFAPLGNTVYSEFARYQPSEYYAHGKSVSLNIPAVAKTTGTSLRWRQLKNSGKDYDVWMIDDVVLTSGTSILPDDDSKLPVERAMTFSEDFDVAPDFPGGKWRSISGGNIAVPDCGTIDVIGYSGRAAFFSDGSERFITTQPLNLENAGDLSFRLLIGGLSGCENADPGEDVIVEYSVNGSATFYELRRLSYDAYRNPTTIVIPLSDTVKTQSTSLRWRQMKNDGKNYDEWAIDHIRITSLVVRRHVIEFDMRMTCGTTTSDRTVVNLQFSNDYGRRWRLVQKPCWPTDPGCVQSLFHSRYSPVLFPKWRKITVLLPPDAVGRFTQFRWRETEKGNWAIDNVYIGVQCPNFCSGHGRCVTSKGDEVGRVCGGRGNGQRCSFPFVFNKRVYNKCTREGREELDNELWCATTPNYDRDALWGFCTCGVCECDPGYRGESCDQIVDGTPRAKTFKEDFESLNMTRWSTIAGVSLGNDCGVVADGKAAIFSIGTTRVLETADVYVPLNSSLEFFVTASGSSTSPCGVTSDSQTGVYVQYSVNGGATWYLLERIRPPTSFKSIFLPVQTETTATRFRWYQPDAGGDGLQMWAIDDVSIQTRSPISTPVVDGFDPINAAVWKRHLQSQSEYYCGSLSIVQHFQTFSLTLSVTYLTLNFVKLTPDTSIQFDLLVTCGEPYNSQKSVTLQYSKNGLSYSYLSYGCSPAASRSSRCHPGRSTRYYPDLYSSWRRVTIALNRTSLGLSLPSTVRLRWYGRFRGSSSTNSTSTDWAIDNVYVGERCPGMCNGHGRCNSSDQCVCDVGFLGIDCSVSSKPLATQLQDDFSGPLDRRMWAIVSGGNVTTACVEFFSALLFKNSGGRELVTTDLDTTNATVVSFRYHAASKRGSSPCSSTGSVYVLLDYSNNGGVSWSPLLLLRHTTSNSMDKQVVLPNEARTPLTRFRWWQSGPSHSNYAIWAITDIFIGTDLVCQNGGTLNPEEDNSTPSSCECPPKFTGNLCQFAIADPCTPNPCLNGGSCEAKDDGAFECYCRQRYTGRNCSEPISSIHGCTTSDRCFNGGTCVPTKDGTRQCLCPIKFWGPRCRYRRPISTKALPSTRPTKPVTTSATIAKSTPGNTLSTSANPTEFDPCEDEPCGKNGVCKRSFQTIEGFTCRCFSGFMGTRCKQSQPAPPVLGVCQRYHICQNGGTCVSDNTSLLLFHCFCPVGFSGVECSVATVIPPTRSNNTKTPFDVAASLSNPNNGIPPWAWIVFATGIMIVIAILVAAIILRGRKNNSPPLADHSSDYAMHGSGGDVVAFDNPIADFETDSSALAASTDY